DNGSTWSSDVASILDYTQLKDYEETFRSNAVPFLIFDNEISNLTMFVKRNGKIDEAELSLQIEHENSADLRIWLNVNNYKKLLLFDREYKPTNFDLTIDLIDLGLTSADFDGKNFTLEIHDFSESFSGLINNFRIKLTHYKIPLGYQFSVTIPPSNNDTSVLFYLTLIDNLDFSTNTTLYTYHTDGLAPNISVVVLDSELNLAGDDFIRTSATIIDAGGIANVEIYYKYNLSDSWIIEQMTFDEDNFNYFYDIPILKSSGTVYYKVRAFDYSGLNSESVAYSTNYSNALAPKIILLDLPYPSPLDLQGAQALRIRVNATDDGEIEDIQLKYRFSETDEFTSVNMTYDTLNGYYYVDIIVPTITGNLSFSVIAEDNNQLTGESIIVTINYINATIADKDSDSLLVSVFVFLLGSAVLIGGVGAIGYLLYSNKEAIMDRLKKEDELDD
ncbi:MAG: hypothetical protein ACXAC7_20900, partial [Candidatus Hodarchaeales archaeon]